MTTEQFPAWGEDHLRYVVSQALPEDRRDVERLVRQCGKEVRDYFDMRNLDAYWDSGSVWMLHVSPVEEPVGFAVVYMQRRKPVLSLYDIGVHPEWRRFGLGTALMYGVFGWYREKHGAERLRLVVSATNDVAIGTYRKWGLEALELKETRRNGTVAVMEGVPWS